MRSRAAAVDAVRETWTVAPRVHDLVRDLRHAARMLRRNVALTVVVVLTLGLGIGTNTAIFSVARAILLRSLPVRAPHELVLLRWISGPNPDVAYLTGEFSREAGTGHVSAASLPYPAFLRLREESRTLTDLLASGRLGDVAVNIDGQTELADVDVVSGSYFGALGISAVLGRPINPADDRPGVAQVAVLSHHFWDRRFKRDPSVLGRTLAIQAVPFTIVGVAPAGFEGTMQLGSGFDLALPVWAQAILAPDRPYLSNPKWYWLQVMARLSPNVPLAQAETEVNAVMRGAIESTRDRPQLRLAPGHQGLTRARNEQRVPLLLLTTVAGFVLVMSCASI